MDGRGMRLVSWRLGYLIWDFTYSRRRLVALELLNVEVLDKVCSIHCQLNVLNIALEKNAPRRATALVAKVRCERKTVRACIKTIEQYFSIRFEENML